MGQDPDLSLVRDVQAGDERAFDALLEKHQERVFHFVCRHVLDRSDAEEIAQEAFVRAYFGIEKFRPDALFSTWLFRIALNLCRDHLRRRGAAKVLRTESISANPSLADDSPDREFAAPTPSPSASASHREELALAEREIAKLPYDLRSPLILTALEGLSQEEAGRLLGISAKAVEGKVYRARKLLAQKMGNRH